MSKYKISRPKEQSSRNKQPDIIALKDFRLHTQSFIDKIADGQSFIVVKRSKPVFRLLPIDKN